MLLATPPGTLLSEGAGLLGSWRPGGVAKAFFHGPARRLVRLPELSALSASSALQSSSRTTPSPRRPSCLPPSPSRARAAPLAYETSPRMRGGGCCGGGADLHRDVGR